MKAVILAAGLGTRLRPWTDRVPKALVPILHRPSLLRVADRLRAAGVGTLCVNTHHLADQVVEALRGQDAVVVHEPEILDSGGGVANFRELLAGEECFLVHNCDVYSNLDLGLLVEEHRARGSVATLALVSHPPTDKVLLEAGGRVRAIEPGPGTRWTYSGVAVLSPEVLAALPAGVPSSLVDAFRALIRRGAPVLGHLQPGAWWSDFGDPASYLALHEALLAGRAPWPPDGTPPGPWSVEVGALVDPGARLEGWGCLSAGARVGAGATLRNCVVWPGARVAPGTFLADRIVADPEGPERP